MPHLLFEFVKVLFESPDWAPAGLQKAGRSDRGFGGIPKHLRPALASPVLGYTAQTSGFLSLLRFGWLLPH